MKKVDDPNSEKDIRPEYRREDLGKGVRGKYYGAYSKGTKKVFFLDPKLATNSKTSGGNAMENEDADTESSPITCFVIGPIGDRDATPVSQGRQTYEEAIEVWEEVILPACEAFGITPIRADHIHSTGEIPEQVFRRLRDEPLVIADLTGANPNVMYELGLRHTTGKLTIQIGERSRLPFDISAIRTIQFKRTEAGLIHARKQLTQTISEGLQRGGDPVSATRVWFELPALSRPDSQFSEEAALGGEDEPGILEKLSDMHEGMESATKIIEVIANVFSDIGGLASEAAAQTERINNSGGAPAAKLEIASRLAKKLEDPATRFEVLAGEYSHGIERIHPGMTYLLSRLRDNPEDREQAGEFPQQVVRLVEAMEVTISQLQGFRASLLESGEATRELRKINRRIVASLDLMSAAHSRIREWKQLLAES